MIEDINGVAVWKLSADGAALGSGASASDLVGELYGQGADLIAIPAARLGPEFFRLASGLAGEFIQKLQNHGYRIAVVGDIAAWVARSKPLADFVRESNRHGRHLFVDDIDELRSKLRPA
jgi:hypothetical protein